MKNLTRKTAVKIALITLAIVLAATLTIVLVTTFPPDPPTTEDTESIVTTFLPDLPTTEDTESIDESEAEKPLPVIANLDTRQHRQQPAQQSSPSATPATNTPYAQAQQAQTEFMERYGIDSAQLRGVGVADSTNIGSNSPSDSGNVGSSDTNSNISESNTPSPVSSLTIANILAAINEARAEAGLAAMQTDSTMNQAAQIRATEVVGTWSHTRPCGRSAFTAVQDLGYFATGGEALGTGTNVVNLWLNSPEHRQIILGSASIAGIGVSGRHVVLMTSRGAPRLLAANPCPTCGYDPSICAELQAELERLHNQQNPDTPAPATTPAPQDDTPTPTPESQDTVTPTPTPAPQPMPEPPPPREQPPAPSEGCWDFDFSMWAWVRSPDCGCEP